MTIYTSDALRPIAGNQYVPDSMETRGIIKPLPPINGVRNGVGILNPVGLWAYDWGFSTMTRTELQWWCDLVGYITVGTPVPFSKKFVTATVPIVGVPTLMPACRLWLLNTAITPFSSCVIDVPTWESYHNGRYHDVKVHFSFMQP